MSEESRGLTGLGEIAAKLDGAGMQWAVFAGAAASVYGAERPVTDVDILVRAAEGNRLMALFPEAEMVSFQPGLMHLKMPGVDLLAGLGEVDLDLRMAARVTRHEIGGVLVPVIPREDNILLKAMWGRGPREGKHDWEDVEAMMNSVPSLDWEYLRWRAGTLDKPGLGWEILRRLEGLWLRRQGEEEERPGEQH
jgi:hypothetical protein